MAWQFSVALGIIESCTRTSAVPHFVGYISHGRLSPEAALSMWDWNACRGTLASFMHLFSNLPQRYVPLASISMQSQSVPDGKGLATYCPGKPSQ